MGRLSGSGMKGQLAGKSRLVKEEEQGEGMSSRKDPKRIRGGEEIIFAKAMPGSRLERETVHKAGAAVAVCGES